MSTIIYTMPENTGLLIYTILIQINDTTGLPTGVTKPNNPDDPDYIAPLIDEEMCPITGD